MKGLHALKYNSQNPIANLCSHKGNYVSFLNKLSLVNKVMIAVLDVCSGKCPGMQPASLIEWQFAMKT